MTNPKATRAPKLLGDFGEGLVTYALIRKGYEVANVDHVGADLIAEKEGQCCAVSVKTRLFRGGSKESRVFSVEYGHLEKLKGFAERFGLIPVFALAVCIADEREIHLLMMRVDDLEKHLPRAKHGYSLRFSRRLREELIRQPFVDHSCWTDESIGDLDF